MSNVYDIIDNQFTKMDKYDIKSVKSSEKNFSY